jgi:hypothetical protein
MVSVILAARCVAGKGVGGMIGDKEETATDGYKMPSAKTCLGSHTSIMTCCMRIMMRQRFVW